MQLDQKWEALEGLQREAQKQAAAVAKLEADLAHMQGQLDALPAPLPSDAQAGQGTPDMLALRKEIADLNAKVNGARFVPTHNEDATWRGLA